MKFFFLGLVLAALITLPAHFGYSAIDETIVIYLSFDEGTGKKIKDQSKYGNHGEIIKSTEWVDGKFGKAVKITVEETDCVVVPNVLGFNSRATNVGG